MLKKYTYGKPFNTEAVTFIPENTIHFNDEYKLPHGTITKQQTENGENVLVLTIPLLPEDRIFGLGETTGGINKRGHIYKSWCTDDPNHTEEKQQVFEMASRFSNCCSLSFSALTSCHAPLYSVRQLSHSPCRTHVFIGSSLTEM